MMILVLGAAGRVGTALLKDLIRSDSVDEIVAADLNLGRLKHVVQNLEYHKKIQTTRIDAANYGQLVELMRGGFDCVASVVLAGFQYDATRAAIEAGVNFVDADQPYRVFGLNEQAKAAGITVIPSCGLDPGIDRICRGYAIGQFDKVTSLYAWCGGLPQRPWKDDNPLHFKIAWVWHRAIASYRDKARILRDGKVVDVPKLEPPESPKPIVFPEPIGECETFTSRAPFDLIEQLNLKTVMNACDKIVRYKGHCDLWRKLIALHLTDYDPLQVNMQIRPPSEEELGFETKYLDQPIELSPFEFLHALGNKYFQYNHEKGEGDAVVLRTQVVGSKNGKSRSIEHEMIDLYDPVLKISAMSRTTAFPMSIVCQMIAKGEIKERGVVHTGKLGLSPKIAKVFFKELTKRNIHITETVRQPL